MPITYDAVENSYTVTLHRVETEAGVHVVEGAIVFHCHETGVVVYMPEGIYGMIGEPRNMTIVVDGEDNGDLREAARLMFDKAFGL